MKKGKVEVKSRQKPTNVKQATKPKVENIKNNQVPQTLIDKLSRIEKLVLELDKLKRTMNLSQIKNIDLIKFLRGTQYSTNIKQLFEFDLTIQKLMEGFGKLQCTYPNCENQAFMALKSKSGEPAMQYCDSHFKFLNCSTESLKSFELELKAYRILFDEIEIQLVYIQDRIDYIKSDKNEENKSHYDKIENEIQRNLDNINRVLKTMTERVYQIEENYKTKSKNKASILNFSDFSFIRKDLSEWRENILSILSLISEPLKFKYWIKYIISYFDECLIHFSVFILLSFASLPQDKYFQLWLSIYIVYRLPFIVPSIISIYNQLLIFKIWISTIKWDCNLIWYLFIWDLF